MSSTRASYTDCRSGTGRCTGRMGPGDTPSPNIPATLITASPLLLISPIQFIGDCIQNAEAPPGAARPKRRQPTRDGAGPAQAGEDPGGRPGRTTTPVAGPAGRRPRGPARPTGRR